MKLFKPLLVLVFSMFSIAALAQGGIVKAILMDSDTGETLPFATVSLTPEGASKPTKYTLSTSEGVVAIEGVRKGNYTLKVELMGYKATDKKIAVVPGKNDLGKLSIEPDQQVLDAAKVSDVGNPITVKKDTIEYNATLFKTSENDMLIDLLKKLPGIEVESDGSITANGKTIKKITISGKTFFLDDPQLATQNIPSKIIEKVKVVDKKSDQAMFTGIDDGEEETIIDLNIKKGMMKGWFGNFMAGGGHDIPSKNNTMNDWRGQGAGFTGNFTDDSQISIILNGNNTNNRGFNDLAGSMMGNMRGPRGGRGESGGITTSWMGGVNGAWNLLGNKMDLGGNYLYNGTKKDLVEDSEKKTYLGDSDVLNYRDSSVNNTLTQGHRVGIRLEHKFNKNTSIVFEPKFNYGYGNYLEQSVFNTTQGDSATFVNKGFNHNTGNNKNWNLSGTALLRQRLGKAGRTMTVSFGYDVSNNKMNGYNQSMNISAEELPELTNQRFDQNAFNTKLNAGITYTEPLAEKWFLEANYRYSWRNQTSSKNTWDSGEYDPYTNPTSFIYNPKDEQFSNAFSNKIINTSQVHRTGANVVFQKKKVNVQVGFSANPTITDNKTYRYDDAGQPIEKAYHDFTLNWAPQMSVRFDASENSNLRFNYNGESNQPTTSQLMPVPDNSNPLSITLGNPQLKPYFQHSFRGMYRYTNKRTFTSIGTFFDGGIVQNPIGSTSWYEADGSQFSLPMNSPNTYNANVRLMINSPLGKSKFSIFSMTRMSYSNSSNYVSNGVLDMSPYYNEGDKYDFLYDNFLRDWDKLVSRGDFSLNNTQSMTFMERLRLTFRCDLVELSVGGRTRLTKAWYTVMKGNTNNIWNNTVDMAMNWTIPGGVGLNADCNYNWYRGYTTSQPSTAILNVEITKLLWKNRMTLALKGYDLLGMSRNISVSDTANYHMESTNNTLGRYVILSLTYRFGNFDSVRDKMDPRKNGGRGPGGHGPGGFGGPMGPPPGR